MGLFFFTRTNVTGVKWLKEGKNYSNTPDSPNIYKLSTFLGLMLLHF